MKKVLTPEKLVLLVYGEISDPKEKIEIEKAIHNDSEWHKMYTELLEAREMLIFNNDSPPDDVIKKIMDYSKSLGTAQKKNYKKD